MALSNTEYVIERGTDFDTTATLYTIVSGVKSPVNVTGYTAVMEIRSTDYHTTADAFYTLTTSGLTPQITIPVGTDGKFWLNIPAADTALFKFNQAYFDLIVISPAGKKKKLVKGIIKVNQSVSV